MARPITQLAIFFLAFNLFSGFVMATGLGAMVGVETSVGGDQAVENATSQAEEYQTGAPTGSTLFGMYNVLSIGLSTLTAPITAGPTMLSQVGMPSALKNMVLIPIISVVYAIGILSFTRGWGL